MTVEDLIASYGEEEIGIVICDSDTEKYLIPFIWKTDYIRIYPPTGEYICKGFHIYDSIKVDYWTIEDDRLHIYIILN